MKSNTRKKILALFAAGVLATAGVAWAAVTGALFTPNGVATDLNVAGVLGGPATPAADINTLAGARGVTLVQSGTQTNNLVLPSLVNIIAGQTNPAVTTTIAPAFAAYNHWQGNFNFDATAGADQVWGGAIMFADGQELTIRPGAGFAVTAAAVAAPGPGNIGSGGMLRLNGGITNLWAGNGNSPTNTITNNYDAGTFLMRGRLNVAHSLAVGRGPITLAHNTTLGVIETSNVDLGGVTQEGLNLKQPGNAGAVPTGNYHQNIVVRRYDNNTTDGIQNVRPVTIDVPTVSGQKSVLRLYAGLTQPIRTMDVAGAVGGDGLGANGEANGAPDFFSTRVEKTGTGTMHVFDLGMRHTGGTHVREGRLFVDGGQTDRYRGELGRTWAPDGVNPYVNVAVETDSAKLNYNRYIAAVNAAWTRVTFTQATGTDPAYMFDYTNTAVVGNGSYVNPLTIDAGAEAAVNRDQFIGDFNGAGTFESISWVKDSNEVIPQLTMQLNRTLSVNNGQNADFSGSIIGKVNLVLDNPVLVTGAGANANQIVRVVNYFPRMQVLSGTNNIEAGDTFIKDGTLSINKATNIGPDTLRVGMYDAGYINAANGMDPGTANFRGFGETWNVATFHASETMTINQKTLVFAVGKNLAPSAPITPATLSTTWYGNNPENAAIPLAVPDGRYNVNGPFVNLAATRGKMVSFPDITLTGENAAVPTITQMASRNDIRYIMRNAMAVNDKMDENTNWDGTVEFPASWDLIGATSARMFGFDVKAGVLQLGAHQQDGYALVGLRQGATLSLNGTARDFGDDMSVVIEDDARIRVKPQTTDLAASLAEAQTKDAVFIADSINYTGLGMGQDHMDKRIVVQIDLTNIGNAITDQWIKVVGSHNAVNWNNIHFYNSVAGQTEHLYKVKVAQPNNMVFDGNYSVTPYCDENQYNIYVHIKKIDQPTPGTNFTFDAAGGAVATNAQISGTALLKDNAGAPVASQDVTFYLFHAGVDTSNNANAIENMTSTTDANGVAAYLFNKGGYGNGASYVVKAVATGYGDATKPVTTAGAPTPSGSSSSGCDAGFGAFALLAMAGGALVLRKKD